MHDERKRGALFTGLLAFYAVVFASVCVANCRPRPLTPSTPSLPWWLASFARHPRGHDVELRGIVAAGLEARPPLEPSGGGRMKKAANVSDYRALAKARLPHFLFEYLDGGSYDEVTLRRNVEDLQSVALRQRVLRDVSTHRPVDRVVRAALGDAGRAWGRSACRAFMRGAAKFRRRRPPRLQTCRSRYRPSAPARIEEVASRRAHIPGSSSISSRIAASSAT